MDLDQLLVADRQQAVPLEVLDKVVVDRILVQILSLDQELCLISKFQHNRSSFLMYSAGFMRAAWFVSPCACSFLL